MLKKTIVVVDPISSGLHLAEEIVKIGHTCIGIQSLHDERHPISREAMLLFEELIDHTDLDSTVAQLLRWNPSAIIAGCEPAVELADALAARLMLRGNLPEKSFIRRNKYEMQQGLRKAGLHHINQIRTADIDRAISWALNKGLWPLVVKPLESAGTDGVHICDDLKALTAAFRSICGRKNIYGATNIEVLLQEFIAGEEYVVDAVLRDGTLVTAAIWKYSKQKNITGAPIYRYIEIISFNGEQQVQLIRYTQEVLKALEIYNGPVHVELMWSHEDNKPVLIEAAARMHGGLGAVVPKLVCGTNQVELTIDAYTEGEAFRSDKVIGYEKSAHLVELFLVSTQEGLITDYPINKLLPKLESYATHKLWVRNNKLTITNDLWTSPGVVILKHENREVIQRDIDTIIQLEASQKLFELSTALDVSTV